MLRLAEDGVDFAQMLQMAAGKALLIRNEEIFMGKGHPTREDTLQKNIGIKARLSREESRPGGNAAAMADRHLEPGALERAVDEIDVLIEPDTVGAGDYVDMRHGGVQDIVIWRLRIA